MHITRQITTTLACMAAVLSTSLWVFNPIASGQSILDRVEQNVRDDVRAATDGADAGQDAPAAGETVAPGSESGYLGLIADEGGNQNPGVLVREVMAGTPAATGGIQVGDVITSIDRAPVRKMDEMGAIMSRMPAGTKLDFEVNRNGQMQILSVTLSKRPAQSQLARPLGRQPAEATERPSLTTSPSATIAGSTAQGPRLGVRTLPITEDARTQFGLPTTSGALVSSITVGSPAELAGIPLGSVITAIDDQPIRMPDDLGQFIRNAKAGQTVDLTYWYRGQSVSKQVTLAAPAASSPTNVRPALPAEVGEPTPVRSPSGARPTGDMGVALQQADARISQLEAKVDALERRLQRLEQLQGSPAGAGIRE